MSNSEPMTGKQRKIMKGEKKKLIVGCNGRKRKYFHKWNNDLTKCKACGATDVERIKALRTSGIDSVSGDKWGPVSFRNIARYVFDDKINASQVMYRLNKELKP